LIVRETEAEDQRQVTIVLHTRISDPSQDPDFHNLFEEAVSLAASLAILFTQQAYEVRLVIGEQQLSYETSEAHLYRMLSALALCRPTVASPSHSREPLRLTESRGNEFTVHVLPRPDPRLAQATQGRSRVLVASECR
jgi:uncharacterized protein (DUF58 family)